MQRFAVTIALVAPLSGCADTPPPPTPPPLEVTVVEVEPHDTPVVSTFVGKTQSSRRVEIRARIDGFLEKRAYDEGSMVEDGQVLFEMDRKPMAAQLQAARAELDQHLAALATARAQLDRIRPLAEQNAVAQKELDDADGHHSSAAAAVEAARAKVVEAELNLGYCTITSPVNGLTSFARQQDGAYISFGDSLLTYVAQIDPMYVEFSISENQLLKGRDLTARGLLVTPPDDEMEVEVVLADGTVYPYTGRITFADASLSEETGTFLLRAEVENPNDRLRPGQFVRVHLKGHYRPDAILLPQRAVQQGPKGSFVWVIEGTTTRFQPVTVSAWLEDEWFVDTGLEGGEMVVVDGAMKLQADMTVQVVPASGKAARR